MRLLFAADDIVASFVAQGLGIIIYPPYTCIGIVDDDGNLKGGIVYNHYNGFDVEITIYGPGCMKRGVIRAALSYPFEQLGVLRVSAKTRRDNALMRSMFPRFGFEFEGVKARHYGPHKRHDAFMFRLMRDKNKWS